MLKEKINNPRWPHHIYVERTETGGDPFSEDKSTSTIYDGKGRSYTDATTTGGGTEESRVDVNKRKVSIPVRFDEWKTPVEAGDSITATIGNSTETGMVKDVEPDNNRTVIYWEVTRN